MGLADELDLAPCPRHPGRDLRFACPGCGAKLCFECGHEVRGARHCERCTPRAEVAADAAQRFQDPSRWSGTTLGLFSAAALLTIVGALYALLRPSVERAKLRARFEACEAALGRVHDAARQYALDHRGALPEAVTGGAVALVDDLVREGYLRARPKHLAPGWVRPGPVSTSADPRLIYVVDDEAHGPAEDGSVRHHVLCVDGTVLALPPTHTALVLAAGTTAVLPSATASPSSPTATALPASPTPTASTPGGGP